MIYCCNDINYHSFPMIQNLAFSYDAKFILVYMYVGALLWTSETCFSAFSGSPNYSVFV